jgi:hypothetical protein
LKFEQQNNNTKMLEAKKKHTVTVTKTNLNKRGETVRENVCKKRKSILWKQNVYFTK